MTKTRREKISIFANLLVNTITGPLRDTFRSVGHCRPDPQDLTSSCGYQLNNYYDHILPNYDCFKHGFDKFLYFPLVSLYPTLTACHENAFEYFFSPVSQPSQLLSARTSRFNLVLSLVWFFRC